MRRDAAAVALFAAFTAFCGVWSLPPLDRDEARFAQASAQMLETGDFVTIRFQDAERNKKPAGIHWLQAGAAAATGGADARAIWRYRLPSAIAGVAAALFVYAVGRRLYGAETARLAALLFAAAPVVAAETAIAKTDAALIACVCAAQWALITLYADGRAGLSAAASGWVRPLTLWGALAAGVLIKGPVAPLIVGAAAATLVLNDRLRGGVGAAWLRRTRPIAGAALFAALVAPWAVAVGLATEGRFFIEALGGDLLNKVGAAQESHPGPPGYHAALTAILFWPAAALIASALQQAATTRRSWRT
ncbi:MAG: glycosyltransferase family 39 protein, partial [Pseudomonadota bacterium]